MKRTLIPVLAAALACSGCSSYINSPAYARAREAKRAEFSDPLIARAANAKPAMRFPATIAIAPNDRDVREHVRALSALGKLDNLNALPQLARTTIISPALIGAPDHEH